MSSLDELLGADFQHLPDNALYRASGELLKHRDEIEKRLAEKKRAIFCLGEKIILYDLTTTYLWGSAQQSQKARRGRSKQKRNDCPLLTLALVLDSEGETILYCQSTGRARKEEAMKASFHFEIYRALGLALNPLGTKRPKM